MGATQKPKQTPQPHTPHPPAPGGKRKGQKLGDPPTHSGIMEIKKKERNLQKKDLGQSRKGGGVRKKENEPKAGGAPYSE